MISISGYSSCAILSSQQNVLCRLDPQLQSSNWVGLGEGRPQADHPSDRGLNSSGPGTSSWGQTGLSRLGSWKWDQATHALVCWCKAKERGLPWLGPPASGACSGPPVPTLYSNSDSPGLLTSKSGKQLRTCRGSVPVFWRWPHPLQHMSLWAFLLG